MALAMALAPATATAMAMAAMALAAMAMALAIRCAPEVASGKAGCSRRAGVRSGGAGVRKAGQLLQRELLQLAVYNLHGAGASHRGSQSWAASRFQRSLGDTSGCTCAYTVLGSGRL